MKLVKYKNRITDVWDYPKLSIYNNQIEKDEHYFDFLDEPNSNGDFRLYIHIPFCNSFCSYCQFYKEPYKKYENALEAYFNNVIKELNTYAKKKFFADSTITSIFFGGGDPSIIKYEYFELLMKTIYDNFNVCEKPSISIEGNIKNLLDEKRLEMYKKHNISRISFGVQTFNEDIRKKLLIKPTIDEIYTIAERLKAYQFESFAFDLMYNLPNQTEKDVEEDIKKAIALGSDYIDFYSLNLYPNTKFYKDIYENNKFKIVPTKERELAHNRLIQNIMTEEGYKQVISCTYSNKFETPHFGLYHYLQGENMLGIGPSARSFLNGHGYRNVCSVDAYSEMLQSDKLPIETGVIISDAEQDRRLIVLGINLFKVKKALVEKLPDITDKMNQLIDFGYIYEDGENYCVSDEGRAWVGNMQKTMFSEEIASKDMTNFLRAVKDGRSAYNQDFMSINKFK